MSPDTPLQLGLDSRQQFCLQSLPSMERVPLQYTVCVARNVKAAHQDAAQTLSPPGRELPNMKALWLVQFRLRLVDGGVGGGGRHSGVVITPISQAVVPLRALI